MKIKELKEIKEIKEIKELNKKNILFVVATRPNFIKTVPVYLALKKLNIFNITILHTNQHYDKNMSDIFIDLFKLNIINLNLDLVNKSQATQLSLIILGLEEYLINKNYDLIVTSGDVTSSLATALVANKLNIKLAHIESGLRSYDKSMPEETNRVLVDHLSDILFTTEKSSVLNLTNENLTKNIYFVGNTMIDSLVNNINIAKKLENNYKNYILVTLHRPQNVDNINILTLILDKLHILAETYNIVFPMHPRTLKNLKNLNSKLHKNIILLEPQGYLEFLNLQYYSKFIITDSGGVQEEAAYLEKLCLILRPNTERLVETANLINIIDLDILKINKFTYVKPDLTFWDGHASTRIANILQEFLI